jgi:proteasome accessory factor A
MLDRLVGLETEYAVRFRPRAPGDARPANTFLFERLMRRVCPRAPSPEPFATTPRGTVANGGGLKLERLPFYAAPNSGFVEGSTPPCRGPRQLLRYQRAQDVLLSEGLAAGVHPAGQATLLKNSHDGRGHYFGCHENYEAVVASGSWLALWRLGLVVALPLFFVLLLAADTTALYFFVLWRPLLTVLRLLPGREASERVWSAVMSRVVTLSRTPLQVFGSTFTHLVAFREVRRPLLAFLVSRSVIVGAGLVHADGRFSLSPRALGLRSLCGVTAAAWRSVFYFCHIIKAAASGGIDPGANRSVFGQRLRLQISIADSNMTQWAEYLKVGTTLLVLDAIEAGELQDAPLLRRPLRALRAICADPELRVAVPLQNGERRTALQLQRHYLDACRRYVEARGEAREEAREILKRWEETLDALETNPSRLVGKVDWVTKKYLLDGLGPDAPIEARRKLDLRYHELAPDGYYLRLEAAGVAPTLVEPEDVRNSMRVPPEGTPAALGTY